MMRLWQYWWRTFIFSIQNNPPEFVEYLMMSFAMGLAIKCFFTAEWPYIVLSLSFAIGAAISMWVREWLIPSPRKPVVTASASLLFLSGLTGFVYLAWTYPLYR